MVSNDSSGYVEPHLFDGNRDELKLSIATASVSATRGT